MGQSFSFFVTDEPIFSKAMISVFLKGLMILHRYTL